MGGSREFENIQHQLLRPGKEESGKHGVEIWKKVVKLSGWLCYRGCVDYPESRIEYPASNDNLLKPFAQHFPPFLNQIAQFPDHILIDLLGHRNNKLFGFIDVLADFCI